MNTQAIKMNEVNHTEGVVIAAMGSFFYVVSAAGDSVTFWTKGYRTEAGAAKAAAKVRTMCGEGGYRPTF